MELVGFGILSWNSEERRSKRYGYIFLDNCDFRATVTVPAALDDLSALVGQKVHMFCEVVESRESGHLGDLAIQVFPSRPEVGEIVDLGVGILHVKQPSFTAATFEVGLLPEDGRGDFWIDPRQLYRVHDQTVRLMIASTEAACSPVAMFDEAPAGVISTGDNGFQYNRLEPKSTDKLAPRITPLGDGMFRVDHDHQMGEPISLIRDDPDDDVERSLADVTRLQAKWRGQKS